MINVLGLDLSLSHTSGWHAFGPMTGLERRGFAIQTTAKQHPHPLARLASIRTSLLMELGRCQVNVSPGLAFVEGYAFGAKCAREAMGEVGGMARLMCFELGWTVVIVPPTTLKAFVTGKGVAPKERMMLEAFKRWGYSSTDNNDCDAYALMKLGLEYCAWLEGGVHVKKTAELLRKLTPWEKCAA